MTEDFLPTTVTRAHNRQPTVNRRADRQRHRILGGGDHAAAGVDGAPTEDQHYENIWRVATRSTGRITTPLLQAC